MKSTLLALISALTLTTFTAAADMLPEEPTATAAQVAELLIHRNVRPCLAQLQQIQDRYDLATSHYSVARDENEQGAVTSIVYEAIEGGDMMMGSVTLVINEVYGQQFGFPESRMLVVKGCSIIKNIIE